MIRNTATIKHTAHTGVSTGKTTKTTTEPTAPGEQTSGIIHCCEQPSTLRKHGQNYLAGKTAKNDNWAAR